MAITRTNPEPPEGELPLLINNGDLIALKSAVDRLGFKDEESLLRYMLAVLSKSGSRSITVIDLDGKSVAFTPNETLLSRPEEKTQKES